MVSRRCGGDMEIRGYGLAVPSLLPRDSTNCIPQAAKQVVLAFGSACECGCRNSSFAPVVGEAGTAWGLLSLRSTPEKGLRFRWCWRIWPLFCFCNFDHPVWQDGQAAFPFRASVDGGDAARCGLVIPAWFN
jgi:hypothetical protein